MANHQEANSNNNKVDKFAEALATARQMQQDWLTYGLDFVHLYIEDVNSDWLENWGNDEISASSLLYAIKEFLVSDDAVAVSIRQHLGENSLLDLAVNLEECLIITEVNNRLSAVKNLLADGKTDDVELLNLADSLLTKLTEIA